MITLTLLQWRFSRLGEDFLLWLAKRIPRRLRYWVIIAEASAMTCSPEHSNDDVPDQKVMDLLKWMDKPHAL